MKNRIITIILVVSMILTFVPVQSFAQNVQSTAQASGFKDMKNHWASKTVNELVGKGIISGYNDNTFKPNGNISRAEFCSLINKVFGYTDVSKEAFSDVKSEDWYNDAILKAKYAGIVSGSDNRFNPKSPITRQDASVILSNAFELIFINDTKAKTYKDFDSTVKYAKTAIAILVSKGYMSGFSDNTLKPSRNITRAEAVTLINNIMGMVISNKGEYLKDTVTGNLVVNTPGVTIKNTTIKGDLLLTEGIGEGEVILDSVTVEGNTIIKGGGTNSIIFRNSTLVSINIKKKDKPVRFAFEGKSTATNVNVKYKAKIDLSSDCVIEKMVIGKEAAGTIIEGKGNINNLEINAENITVNGQIAKLGSVLIVEAGVVKLVTEGSTPLPSGSSSVEPTTPTTTPPSIECDWTLVMNDEFNGSTIDTNNWTAVNTDTVYNEELECYRDSNTYIEDGKLILEATKKQNEAKTKDYTSAKLVTQGKKSWTYGKFEIKAKLPEGNGIWPAIWMLPEDDDIYGGWPSGGEIDIMELLGKEPSKIYGTVHYGNPHGEGQGNYSLSEGKKFSDDYHVYGIEWEPGEIRWYIDGQLYYTQNNWFTQNANEADAYTYPAPFDRDFYLILNLAVGGTWPGNPDKSTILPAKMYVDYVKAYELTGRAYRNAGERPVVNTGTARLPLEDGNYIYNGSFDQQVAAVEGVVNKDMSDQITNTSYWTFAHGDANTGAATASNDNGALKVDITNPGDQTYSVQVYQKPINVEKGSTYRVSFDAWASKDRTLTTKVGSEADFGWANYSKDQTCNLTTSKQSYSYEFKIIDKTNPSARLEFNLGIEGANTVWIDNVKTIKIASDPIVEDPNAIRAELPTGNLIYNGTFDQGSKSMEYWNFTTKKDAVASGTVDSDPYKREFKADISNGSTETNSVKLSQDPINLENGNSYKVTFSARASKNRNIKINLGSMTDTDISYSQEQTGELTTDMDTYSFFFEMTADTDHKAQLQFNLGGDTGTVYIDNVSVKSFVSPNTAHFDAEDATRNDGVSDDKDGSVSFNSETASINDSIIIPQDGYYVISYRVATNKDSGWLSVADSTKKETIPNSDNYWRIVTNSVYLKAGKQNIAVFGNDVSLDWFEIATDNIKDGSMKSESANWGYWSNSPAASSKSFTNGMEKISITNVGANPWDIGIQQLNLSLQKGRLYRLSFDAKSTVARAIGVSMDNFDDVITYAKYMTKNVDLTTEMKNYIIDFSMDADSDMNAALTLSLGNITPSVTSEVYFDNVRLVEISDIENNSIQTIVAPIITELDEIVEPTLDNSVYGFENGTEMGFQVKQVVNNTLVSTTATIVNDSSKALLGSKSLKVNLPTNNETEIELSINNPEGLSEGQIVTFNVYCPTGAAITGIMPFILYTNKSEQQWQWASGSNTNYADLTGGWKAIALTVPTDHNGTTQSLGLRIYPSSTIPDTIWIDSISIQNPVPSSPTAINLIANGSFDTDAANWGIYFGEDSDPGKGIGSMVVSNGELEVNISQLGNDTYKPQVTEGGLNLETGATYVVSFKAKASVPRTMNVVVDNDGTYTAHSDYQAYNLTTTMTTYSFDFIMNTKVTLPDRQVYERLVFQLGSIPNGNNKEGILTIDDVSLCKKESNGPVKDIKVGAWLGDWPKTENIASYETMLGSDFDYVNMFIDFEDNFSGIEENAVAVDEAGKELILTWEPMGLSTLDLTSGKQDEYIRQMASDLKKYGKPLMIRFMHEVNSNWYSWAIGYTDPNTKTRLNTNESYKAAYQHIVNIFREESSTNVQFVYNVNNVNIGDDTSFLGAYPGDDFVDVISMDGYNWGTTQSWGSAWQSFNQVFSDVYTALSVKNKPIMIVEYASAEQGGNKADWIRNAFSVMQSDKYPLLFAAVWFDENKETDWRVNSSQAALDAFKECLEITIK